MFIGQDLGLLTPLVVAAVALNVGAMGPVNGQDLGLA